MKLLTANQLRQWDAYTIKHEPINSVYLMERAATIFADRILYLCTEKVFKIFCGLGNNGGDGLVIARILAEKKCAVQVFVIEYGGKKSTDFLINEQRLKEQGKVDIFYVDGAAEFPAIQQNELVVDAIFGTGLSKPVEGLAAEIINHINNFSSFTISVDVPSGLPAEVFDTEDLQSKVIIEADLTLTFQTPKQSFLFAETFKYVGNFEVLDIGLHAGFLNTIETKKFFITDKLIQHFFKPRAKFSHKGSFGHALIVGGSYGKIGAPLLSSKAALRAGCGLVTAFVPKVGYAIFQTALPEAMVITDDELLEIRNFPDTKSYSAIGAGPGLGLSEYTQKAFAKWLPAVHQPLVIDADALNISAQFLQADNNFHFPENSVLTPHPKEFDRLAGVFNNSFQRINKQMEFAVKHKVVVVLKGAHTSIATPDGDLYFNSCGNELLATAGSGDVLTGIITSFLAQGYQLTEAAILGVYVHGLCADEFKKQGNATMIAGDIIEMLPKILYHIGT